MSKFNKLSRAEMKNVLGGTAVPPSSGCSVVCHCPGGNDVSASIKNCDENSCTTDSEGAYCTVGGGAASATCQNWC